MDTTKIYAILKKTTHPVIAVDPKDGQWLGDGNAFYNVDGLPELNEDNLLPLIGIDIDTKSKYTVTTIKLPLSEILLRENAEGDGCVELTDLTICGKAVMRGIGKNAPKAIFINRAYLKPFSSDDEITFITRKMDNNNGYIIIVKRGLFTLAAILPMKFSKDDPSTKQLTSDLTSVLEVINQQEEDTDGNTQMTFEIECRN